MCFDWQQMRNAIAVKGDLALLIWVFMEIEELASKLSRNFIRRSCQYGFDADKLKLDLIILYLQ